MKLRYKILILLGVVTVVVCWAILSFCIKDEFVDNMSLFVNMVVGTGSLMMAVIALFISVLSYKNTESQKRIAIEEKARAFISENNEDIAYVPLCIIARAYDNHHKYFRDIYNAFNLLNNDVQNEVLKQLNYEYRLIKDISWNENAIDKVRNFIKVNDLGEDFLYDGAKYFHRAMRYGDNEYNSSYEHKAFLQDLFNWTPKIFFRGNDACQANITFDEYLRSYLNAKEKNDPLYIINKNKKPLDVLAECINFYSADEDVVCYWVVSVVQSITWLLIEKSQKDDKVFDDINITEDYIKTYEDKYLDVLSDLYKYSQIVNKQ